jgi:glycosyltransferase involved in cell wall biosynthesis
LICSQIHWQKWPVTKEAAQRLADSLAAERISLAHFHFGGTYEWQSNKFWRCPVYYLAGKSIPCFSTNHLAVRWTACGVPWQRPAWQKALFPVLAQISRALVYKRLRLEVAISKHDRARILSTFPFFRHKIIQRYHSLLPADAPPPALAGREPTILCVASIAARKGQSILTEAFGGIAERYPNWKLDLVGRADEPEELARVKAAIERHRLHRQVTLVGEISHAAVVERMQRASIIAMPSLLEGLGLSLQEGLFHGCVAVGSRAGGIPELIDHERNGLLVPPGNPEALGAALTRLMSDHPLLERLRTGSRPSILEKGMTAQAMLSSYLDLYVAAAKVDPVATRN